MDPPVRYYDLIRERKNAFNHRLRLVTYARQHGIQKAAREFRPTVRTVRKWLRRYQAQGLKGREELSRAPHRGPHKVQGQVAQQVLALRRQLPTFSAQRLRRDFDLPVSPRTAYRIWRAHDLVKRRRRKYQKKQDLAAVKATGALFQQISSDTKDLDDLPRYGPQRQAHRLPAIQYTAREVRSGLPFLAFAAHRSAGARALFAQRIQSHLQRCGVDLKFVTWQTDNGGEFIGALQPDGSRSGFPAAGTFFGSQHDRIPPGAPTYQRPSADGSKPSTAGSRTSSTTWKPSAAAASSSPRLPSTSSTSTSPAPIPTKETSPHGRSSSSSIPASPSTSACFLPPSSTIVSTHRGDTIYLDIPTNSVHLPAYLRLSKPLG